MALLAGYLHRAMRAESLVLRSRVQRGQAYSENHYHSKERRAESDLAQIFGSLIEGFGIARRFSQRIFPNATNRSEYEVPIREFITSFC